MSQKSTEDNEVQNTSQTSEKKPDIIESTTIESTTIESATIESEASDIEVLDNNTDEDDIEDEFDFDGFTDDQIQQMLRHRKCFDQIIKTGNISCDEKGALTAGKKYIDHVIAEQCFVRDYIDNCEDEDDSADDSSGCMIRTSDLVKAGIIIDDTLLNTSTATSVDTPTNQSSEPNSNTVSNAVSNTVSSTDPDTNFVTASSVAGSSVVSEQPAPVQRRNGFLGYVTPTGDIVHPDEIGLGPGTLYENMLQHQIQVTDMDIYVSPTDSPQRPRRSSQAVIRNGNRNRRNSIRNIDIDTMPRRVPHHVNPVNPVNPLRPIRPARVIKPDALTLTEKDIMDVNPNPEFIQPIAPNESVDYIELCDQLVEKVKSHDLISTDEIVSGIKKIQDKLKHITDIGRCFTKRDLMISAFCNTAAKIIKFHPGTKGDHDRKCLECPRALESLFADDVYGNPIGSAIHFVFYESSIPDMIVYMDKLKQTTYRPINERLRFGSYRLDSVFKDEKPIRTKSTEIIRYVMIMTDIESNESIKTYAVNIYDAIDVRVQSLDYSGEKIFDAIPDLALRRVVHFENLTKHIKQLVGTMDRTRRALIWEHILTVLDKDVKYLNYGYRYIDIGENKMLKISREETEPCAISAINPPYMKLHLACGHELSVMAICGIVFEGKSEDTQSILCPNCRRNLIPKLVPALTNEDRQKFSLKIYKESDLKNAIDVSGYKFETEPNSLDIIKTNPEQDSFVDDMFLKKENIHNNNHIVMYEDTEDLDSTIYTTRNAIGYSARNDIGYSARNDIGYSARDDIGGQFMNYLGSVFTSSHNSDEEEF